MRAYLDKLKLTNYSKRTSLFLSIGLVLVIYGYICRLTGIYFFWESRAMGWAIVLIGLISLLSDRIKNQSLKENKSILEKIGIGIIVFAFIMQTIIITVFPNTDAFSAAKEYIKKDLDINNELGEIRALVLRPSGGMQQSSSSEGTYGAATFLVTVKGEKKYKDLTLYLSKYVDSDWEVEEIE